MKIDTSRSKNIDAYLKDRSPVANKGLSVIYDGESHDLKAYKIPIKKLIFNIRNGRFASELKAEETKSKKKLDPNNEQDELINNT